MARAQSALTPAELDLVDQMAELTRSKRTDVIKSALEVYHWFVRQALTGAKVVRDDEDVRASRLRREHVHVIQIELRIDRHDRQPFDLRLGDDQSIERVAVMTRQLCDLSGAAIGDGEGRDTRPVETCGDVLDGALRQWQRAGGVLDRHLPHAGHREEAFRSAYR